MVSPRDDDRTRRYPRSAPGGAIGGARSFRAILTVRVRRLVATGSPDRRSCARLLPPPRLRTAIAVTDRTPTIGNLACASGLLVA